MPNEDVDDFLMHYGVKGMQWGKRKASGGEVGSGVSRVEAVKAGAKTAQKTAKKAVKVANKASRSYQSYKERLEIQAYIGGLFGQGQNSAKKLQMIRAVEDAAIKRGEKLVNDVIYGR